MQEPPTSELITQMSAALRSRHYSRRTEQAYCLWVRRFIRFHGIRHPADMAEPEVNTFLTHLAVDEQVSASTQTQALSALLFLYLTSSAARSGSSPTLSAPARRGVCPWCSRATR